MDLDKLAVWAGKFGFGTVVAVWFMWKVQAFMETQITQNATIIEMMRQLIALHQR